MTAAAKLDTQKPLKQPPYDDGGLPLIGYTLHFMHDTLDLAFKLQRRNGNVYRSRQFLDTVSLMGPDAAQYVLQDREDRFSSAEGWAFFVGKLFEGAIMAMDDPQHRIERRIMQQAFKKPALSSYVDKMAPYMVERLSRWQPSRKFMVFQNIKKLTLDLAAPVFMGIELGPEADKLNDAFLHMAEASLGFVRYPVPGTKMHKGMKGREYMIKVLREMIPQKRAVETPDLFSQMCHAKSESGEAFTDDQVINHMIFMMLAAHDTTTSTLTTMIYALGKNTEWQDRLRAHSQTLAAEGLSNLRYDDLDKVDEISWCMKEALRMYPPLAAIPRMCKKDGEFEGYKIKAGQLVNIYPIHTHYMGEYWKNPFMFDPLRFSPERNEHKQHMFQWIPFGGGAHMCLGQHFADLQVRCVMHQLLQHFKWTVPDDYRMPYQLVPIAKPKDGLPVNLQRIG
ncbi:MAG: cytochrome P450 [Moraxellaceae bacterium]|nr:cytochrome P450 [Moraxellaceae bacterium]